MVTSTEATPAGMSDESDNVAFDTLVRQQYAALATFVYRYVRSRAVAEDLVQDVFLGVWERSDSFRYDDPLPYLYRAARNRALSYLRHERVHDRWAASARDREEHTDTESVLGADYDTVRYAVSAAIDALPDRCRAIFIMSREQGLSYGVIAHTLGISVKTVEVQMGRALKSLRARLAPYL